MRNAKGIRPAHLELLEPRWLLSTYPLSSVPQLNSDPGAKAAIYLDFTGAPATTWAGYNVPATVRKRQNQADLEVQLHQPDILYHSGLY